ncbi:ArsR/SmtB family transcription factor [Streptomyces sp. NPDC050528]|uniref:ArsR/SmtB family transcription factor n=1 Tax=unclassified Streptomyces TaxID=2593676 RepID=UPI0037B55675
MATVSDPLWEIALSLHRFQAQEGRWAYAGWFRDTQKRLIDKDLDRVVTELLLPLFPKGIYYPDFLNPAEAQGGLTAGIDTIVGTPPERIREEVRRFATQAAAPAWAPRLVERGMRENVADGLRQYYDTAVAPYNDYSRACLDNERATLGRAMLHGGPDGLLANLGPHMRWVPPVLHVTYPAEDRDLRLDGRGLLLVPSYFCWGAPVAQGDPTLPQVLVYSPHRETLDSPGLFSSTAPLSALLGRTRALILRVTGGGATTGELARAAGVSDAAASQHTVALRNAGLILSHRRGPRVVHTITPLGSALLHGPHQAG